MLFPAPTKSLRKFVDAVVPTASEKRITSSFPANRTKVIRVTVYLASEENDQNFDRSWVDGCVKCIGLIVCPHFARLFQISVKALGRASSEICEEVRSLFARNGVTSYLNESGKEPSGGVMSDIDYLVHKGLFALQEYLRYAVRSDGKPVDDTMPIYRYMPKVHFLDMVENRQIVLSHISLWEDPFEGFIFKSGKDVENRRLMYAGFYGQSWTFGKEESDLRWRAYCPAGDGVRVKTTVGAIRELVERLVGSNEGLAKVLLGPVSYVEDKMLGWKGKNQVSTLHPLVPQNRSEAAKLLFLKRKFFKRENEFRIVCHIGHAGLRELPLSAGAYERNGGLLKCRLPMPVDQLLTEVLLDPRMSVADVDRLKCRLVQSDFNARVIESDIYRWPDFEL